MSQITGVTPLPASLIPKKTPAMTTSGTLRSPLYVAWQVTNECNLACLHCIEESGPGKAFPDELSKEQTFDVLAPDHRQRRALPVVFRRRADGPSAFLRNGRVRLHPRRPAQDRDQRPLPDARSLRAAEGTRRQGGAGQPGRRNAGIVQPHARAGQFRAGRSRACTTCRRRRCRSRSTTPRPASTRTRSAMPSIWPPGWALRASTPAARCTPATPSRPGRSSTRRKSSTRRCSTRCAKRQSSTRAACGCISTRWACSRNCATGCIIPPRC